MRIGVLCSRVRVEEKLLFSALLERGIDYARIDAREVAFDLGGNGPGEYDAVLARCLSHSRAYYLTRWLECLGVPAVSPHRTVATCGDKLLTSAALQEAGVPIPRTRIAFTPEAALESIEEMGYPVVLKPLVGSWGRLSFLGSDPPFRAEKNTPPARALLRAIRAEGGRPRFKLKTGTSDMNVVGPAWGCPIVAYGPGDSSLDHRPDEHIEIEEFRHGIDVLARALQTLGT